MRASEKRLHTASVDERLKVKYKSKHDMEGESKLQEQDARRKQAAKASKVWKKKAGGKKPGSKKMKKKKEEKKEKKKKKKNKKKNKKQEGKQVTRARCKKKAGNESKQGMEEENSMGDQVR